MAKKSSVTKNVKISATGIMVIDKDRNFIGIENTDTGETIDLISLFSEFDGDTVKMSVGYDEDIC